MECHLHQQFFSLPSPSPPPPPPHNEKPFSPLFPPSLAVSPAIPLHSRLSPERGLHNGGVEWESGHPGGHTLHALDVRDGQLDLALA